MRHAHACSHTVHRAQGISPDTCLRSGPSPLSGGSPEPGGSQDPIKTRRLREGTVLGASAVWTPVQSLRTDVMIFALLTSSNRELPFCKFPKYASWVFHGPGCFLLVQPNCTLGFQLHEAGAPHGRGLGLGEATRGKSRQSRSRRRSGLRGFIPPCSWGWKGRVIGVKIPWLLAAV